MAFDQRYYDDRKQKLTTRFVTNKDKLIDALENLVLSYQVDQAELHADFKAIEDMEAANKPTSEKDVRVEAPVIKNDSK